MPLAFSLRPSRQCLYLQVGNVRIFARDEAVAKAVTVVEITKRRQRGVHQCTSIGVAPASASSTRRSAGDGDVAKLQVPTIEITLSMQQMDATKPGCADRVSLLLIYCEG